MVGELERAELISKNPLKAKIAEIINLIVTNFKKNFEKLISTYFDDF
jgi:hypothetical protein